MSESFYWLISITSESAQVSLVSYDTASSEVKSTGPQTAWDPSIEDSLSRAVDTSLSQAASDYKLPPESEPTNSAFIVPPLWVGEDGRIYGESLKLLEHLCKTLKFHPLGYVAYDDAFVESYTTDDSFPGSYILLYLQNQHFQLSLVYLGTIKKRLFIDLKEEFTTKILENSLTSINFSSALPPKIIILGNFTNTLVEDIKNYNWVGSRDVETFLHLPEVITVSSSDLHLLFSKTIHRQLTPTATKISPPPSPVDIQPSESPTSEFPTSESPAIEEVDAASLGFKEEPIQPESIDLPPPPTPTKIKLPHFTFPKINFKFTWLLPLAFLPLVPVIPLFFAEVQVTINLRPSEFAENFNLTLDSGTSTFSPNTIPVSQKSISPSVNVSGQTTGQKEIGEKARGEVVIFNKLDTIQNLNKNTIFSDSSGKKFELTANIQVPGSTYNLDSGIITMGKIKASLSAVNIGPESNLTTGSQLNLSGNQNLLVKVDTAFTGGTRQQVAVVTAQDRSRLLEQAKSEIQSQAISLIEKESAPGLIIFDSTAFFENQKSEFNREVGEVTPDLSLKLQSKVSFLYLDSASKSKIIENLLQNNPKLAGLDPKTISFDLKFTPKTTSATKATGTLTISGKALPLVDTDSLRQLLVSKSEIQVRNIISKLPSFYDYSIENNLKFINLFGRLPKSPSNISIIIPN